MSLQTAWEKVDKKCKILVNHLDLIKNCEHRWCRVRNHWFNTCDPAT